MDVDAREWVLCRVVGSTTARQYAYIVHHACELLEREDLIDAGLEDLRRYLELTYRESESPATRTRRISAIRAWFRARRETDGLWNDAALRLHRPKLDDPLPSWMYASQVRRLFEELELPDVRLRDRALLELIYASGLRLGQIVTLSRPDLCLSERCVRVPGERRIVLIGSTACAALGAYLESRQDEDAAVFLSLAGRRLTRRGASYVIRKIALTVGCSRLCARALRGACAAHLLDGGADVRHVQALMGHRRAVTTERYLRVAFGRMAATCDQAHPRP